MVKSLPWHMLLYVALLCGLSSVSSTETVINNVCQRDHVEVFHNITFTNGNTVNLWINGLRKTLISTWHSFQNPVILEGYKAKVFLDEYGTIWIRNIQLSEEGTYFLQYNTDMKSALKINVMVAPAKQCKPKINKLGSFLMTSLDAKDCGRPTAFAHWMNHPLISIMSQTLAMLSPDNAIGTYIACAETPALQCVKNLQISDYCTTFTIEGQVSGQGTEVQTGKDKDNSLLVSTKISDMKIVIIVTVTLLSNIVITVALYVVVKLIRKRKNGVKRNAESRALDDMVSETRRREFNRLTRNDLILFPIRRWESNRLTRNVSSSTSLDDKTDNASLGQYRMPTDPVRVTLTVPNRSRNI